MDDLILHHYPSSPFSEKIRLVLGYKKLPWKSVVTSASPSRPELQSFTGGYPRVPVLQVGADLYCDSALICDVLEHVRDEPTLYPPHLRGVCRIVGQWADSALFAAAMAYNLQPRAAAHVFASAPPEDAKTFSDDRKAMSASVARLHPADATSAYRSYLRRLGAILDEYDFLFGADPCVADFAAYHPLWYTRNQVPVLADILNATPSVGEWIERMAAIGHGAVIELTSADAMTLASAAEPQPAGANLLIDSAFQDDHGIALGSRVAIHPEGFASETIEGELLAATRTHYSLQRTSESAGLVHVHFPRLGYVLRSAS